MTQSLLNLSPGQAGDHHLHDCYVFFTIYPADLIPIDTFKDHILALLHSQGPLAWEIKTLGILDSVEFVAHYQQYQTFRAWAELDEICPCTYRVVNTFPPAVYPLLLAQEERERKHHHSQ